MGGKKKGATKRKPNSPVSAIDTRPVKAVKSFNPFTILRDTGKIAEETRVLVEARKLVMAGKKKKTRSEEKSEDSTLLPPPSPKMGQGSLKMDGDDMDFEISLAEPPKTSGNVEAGTRKKKSKRKPKPETEESSSEDSSEESSSSSSSSEDEVDERPKKKRSKGKRKGNPTLDAKITGLLATLEKGGKVESAEINLILLGFIKDYRKESKEKDEAMRGLQKEILETRKELKQVKHEYEQIHSKMRRLEMQANAPEIRQAKRSIILRGIPEVGDTENDNVKIAVNKFLERIDMSGDRVENARRRPLSHIMKEKLKKEGKKETRPLQIVFGNVATKYEMFGKLHKLQGWEECKNVRVSNDVPLCLKTLNDTLEAAAREVRMNNKGVKTRVIYADLTLKLQIRKTGEKAWSDATVEKKRKPPVGTAAAPEAMQ